MRETAHDVNFIRWQARSQYSFFWYHTQLVETLSRGPNIESIVAVIILIIYDVQFASMINEFRIIFFVAVPTELLYTVLVYKSVSSTMANPQMKCEEGKFVEFFNRIQSGCEGGGIGFSL